MAGLPPDRVAILDEVGSTNQWLLQQPWQAHPVAPRLVVARRQTAGRGRRGRSWLSGGEESLTFSVSLELRMPQGTAQLSGLPVATGVAIAERLSALTDGIGLKWPNDVFRHGRKVAGLLLESRLQADRVLIVAGLGLNLLDVPGTLEHVGQPAGSLFDTPAGMPARGGLVGMLARVMIEAIRTAPAEPAAGPRSLAQRWGRFDVLVGTEVDILFDGVAVQTGMAAGIDADGALRLRAGGAEHRICAGEVSVRRRPTVDPECAQ